jgi:hypothetical protein
MNYSKPEITSLASASFAIQSGTSKTEMQSDGAGSVLVTSSAYSADE